ncbi:MAG: triose-phosphate isomerase [Bacteroidetes bacterium 4572_128]|nr:MAG: triose-phosphate isomerase [Bacteroidetes bacterium 4572_128]
MKRKNIVAGNWKMNTDLKSGLKMTTEINKFIKEYHGDVKIIIAPPFTHLSKISDLLDKFKISIAAQNCSDNENGAFTGEISVSMLKSLNVNSIIIGHSERRNYFNETDEIISKKVKICLKYKLTPIFCCGENLHEREENKHFEIIKNQLKNGLFDLSKNDFLNVIIAYEPVWAIGTGKTAKPEEAQEMHKFIRNEIKNNYNKEVANKISILYGGSCNQNNAKELFKNKDVDGGLIGGASLKPNDFIKIIKSF